MTSPVSPESSSTPQLPPPLSTPVDQALRTVHRRLIKEWDRLSARPMEVGHYVHSVLYEAVVDPLEKLLADYNGRLDAVLGSDQLLMYDCLTWIAARGAHTCESEFGHASCAPCVAFGVVNRLDGITIPEEAWP